MKRIKKLLLPLISLPIIIPSCSIFSALNEQLKDDEIEVIEEKSTTSELSRDNNNEDNIIENNDEIVIDHNNVEEENNEGEEEVIDLSDIEIVTPTPKDKRVLALDKTRIDTDIYGSHLIKYGFKNVDYNPEIPLIWTSSDESIATVKKGRVKPIGEGLCTITLSYDDLSATCEVNVSNVVKSISIESDHYFSTSYDEDYIQTSLFEGEEATFTPIFKYYDGEQVFVSSEAKYVSSCPDYIDVDQNGKITALKSNQLYYNNGTISIDALKDTTITVTSTLYPELSIDIKVEVLFRTISLEMEYSYYTNNLTFDLETRTYTLDTSDFSQMRASYGIRTKIPGKQVVATLSGVSSDIDKVDISQNANTGIYLDIKEEYFTNYSDDVYVDLTYVVDSRYICRIKLVHLNQ